jgi:uncharacterized short protein YbdD (DUF466 family)
MSGKPSLRERLQTVSETVNAILGVPDYERYVRDYEASHPGEKAPMTRAEFEKDRLHERFIKPGNKCV